MPSSKNSNGGSTSLKSMLKRDENSGLMMLFPEHIPMVQWKWTNLGKGLLNFTNCFFFVTQLRKIFVFDASCFSPLLEDLMWRDHQSYTIIVQGICVYHYIIHIVTSHQCRLNLQSMDKHKEWLPKTITAIPSDGEGYPQSRSTSQIQYKPSQGRYILHAVV